MPEDEVIETETPETPAAAETPAEEEESEYGTAVEIAPNRWQWSKDGVITDVDGVPVEDEEETPPAATPTAVVKPAETTTKPREEKPVVQPTSTAPAMQIWSQQDVHNHIYNAAVKTELAELKDVDSDRYIQRTLELQQQYGNLMEELKNHSTDLFDKQVAQVEKERPEVFEKYGVRLERARRSMSLVQLQTPGHALKTLADMMAQDFINDPDLMREAVLRSMPGKGQQSPPKPAPPTPVRATVNKAVNMPGPGTARKAASGTPEPRRINPRIAHIMKFHDVSEEEAEKLDYDLQHPGGR